MFEPAAEGPGGRLRTYLGKRGRETNGIEALAESDEVTEKKGSRLANLNFQGSRLWLAGYSVEEEEKAHSMPACPYDGQLSQK